MSTPANQVSTQVANPYAPIVAAPVGSSAGALAQREGSEAQMALLMARQFPRDERMAVDRTVSVSSSRRGSDTKQSFNNGIHHGKGEPSPSLSGLFPVVEPSPSNDSDRRASSKVFPYDLSPHHSMGSLFSETGAVPVGSYSAPLTLSALIGSRRVSKDDFQHAGSSRNYSSKRNATIYALENSGLSMGEAASARSSVSSPTASPWSRPTITPEKESGLPPVASGNDSDEESLGSGVDDSWQLFEGKQRPSNAPYAPSSRHTSAASVAQPDASPVSPLIASSTVGGGGGASAYSFSPEAGAGVTPSDPEGAGAWRWSAQTDSQRRSIYRQQLGKCALKVEVDGGSRRVSVEPDSDDDDSDGDTEGSGHTQVKQRN